MRAAAVAVAAVAVTGCGPAPADPDARSRADPTAEVAALLDRYLSAIEARDTAEIRAVYADDGRFVWIEEGEVRYRSPDGVLVGLASFPRGTAIRTELTGLTVVPLGRSAAHAWAGFTTSVGEGSGAYSFGGAISFLTERIDGSWRIVGGHTSSPRGPP